MSWQAEDFRFGSLGAGIVIGVLLLALLIALEVLPYLGPSPDEIAGGAATSAQAVLTAEFEALPPWVHIWMKFQDIIMAAALFFILWQREAQIYGLALLANHLFTLFALPFLPVEKVSLDLIAFGHWIWILPLVVMVRAWPRLDKGTGYGAWVNVAIAQIIFSLIFDIPDGLSFLWSLLSG